MKPIAVYIHIPFCVRKCAYCDFASFAGIQAMWEPYTQTLLKEIENRKEMLRDRNVRSIFFGGGTPSLLSEDSIAAIISCLKSTVSIASNAEITLEANPGTLTGRKLQTYLSAGVNRLSIGVQSFDPDLLKTIGRIHGPQEALDAVLMARKAGFTNISIDLMYALPGQTMAQWTRTLETAVSLPLTHISAYSLILEDGTELKRRADAGELQLPDDDTIIEMQRTATAFLSKHGFERYEISNYAKDGYRSRHNVTYWTDGDYIGFGSAAHSMVNNARFSNPSDITEYLSGVRETDRAERTLYDCMEETLMLSTRMTDGLDMAKWQAKFSEPFEKRFGKRVERLKAHGLATVSNGRFQLTERGLELQDSIVLDLLEEI